MKTATELQVATIAANLNVEVSKIQRVEEWASVFFVVFKGRSPRFVSKALAARKQVSASDAAYIVRQKISGNVWGKKPGEVRLYPEGCNGYLRFAPETETTYQVQFWVKSYDVPRVKAIVERFNALYEITSVGSTEPRQKFWRDEDGNIVNPIENPAEAIIYA